MAKQFWIPSKDQAHVFKGLHSAMVEAATQRGAVRRYAAGAPRAVQLAGAALAAGVVFVAGYWCGARSGSTASEAPPAVVRSAPLTHEQMVRTMKQPDGPRPDAPRAATSRPATPHPAASRPAVQQAAGTRSGPVRPQALQPASVGQQPAQAARPRATTPHPASMGRPLGRPQPDAGPRAAQPARTAPPGSSLPQPGVGGFAPHAARAAAGPSAAGRPGMPRPHLPQPN